VAAALNLVLSLLLLLLTAAVLRPHLSRLEGESRYNYYGNNTFRGYGSSHHTHGDNRSSTIPSQFVLNLTTAYCAAMSNEIFVAKGAKISGKLTSDIDIGYRFSLGYVRIQSCQRAALAERLTVTSA